MTRLDPQAIAGALSGLPLAAVVDRRRVRLYGARVRQMGPTTFAYCSLVVVGCLFETAATAGANLPVGRLAVAVLALAAVVWGQWFVNDVYDKETDRHSNPDRPTTRGDIADREAIAVGSALVGVGVVGTALLNWYALGALVGYVVVNTVYSVPPLRTKDGGLSSMVTLGTMGGCSVLLGAATVVAAPSWLAVRLALIVLVFMAINMSYKDLKDAEYDRRSGVENFAVRYGADTVRRATMVLLPLSYLSVTLYFGLYRPLVVFVPLSAYVAYRLATWDGDNGLVYTLDAINGGFLLLLATSYYVWH